MPEICSSDPLPDFGSLYSSFLSSMTYPPTSVTLPPLPTLPSPMFPSRINITNLEIVKFVNEFQTYQILTTSNAMIGPMASHLGGTIAGMVPSVSGISMNLVDLLGVNPDGLITQVKNEIDLGVSLPFIPIPFYSGLTIPDFSIVQSAGNLVKDYNMVLTNTISGIISDVTSDLGIDDMGALPTMPTFDQIKTDLISQVDGAETFQDVVSSGTPISTLFENLSFPGMPVFSGSPSPLIPSINIPEFELNEILGQYMNQMATASMTTIMDFITGSLSGDLSFSFDTVCVTI